MEEHMQQLIVGCKADYEANRDDPFFSHLYRAKLEELEDLVKLLRELGPEPLLDRICREEPELNALLEQEQFHPTFDMYNEHYHELRLEGKIDARKAVKDVLERQSQG